MYGDDEDDEDDEEEEPCYYNCDDDEEEDDEEEPCYYGCDEDDEEWEDEEECVPVCEEAQECPDSPFENCFMAECHCEGDEENTECYAEWYDFDDHRHEAPCEEYHRFTECLDWEGEDECRFEQCDEHGDCWLEICNEDAEDQCAEPSCQMWNYNHQDDFWEQGECKRPEDEWYPGYHFERFRDAYGEVFRSAFVEVCDHGQCLVDFSDNYLPIIDENDEAIDGFFADDELVDSVHDVVAQAEDYLNENGFDVEFDPIHGLLEQDDHEDLKDAIDGWIYDWSHDRLRKGARHN